MQTHAAKQVSRIRSVSYSPSSFECHTYIDLPALTFHVIFVSPFTVVLMFRLSLLES